MIGDIRKFRFWCQKVLPLVYDDSLSYYEVLCKLVQYLNKVIEDVNSIPEYIDAVIDEKLSDEHLQELIEQFVLNIESAISSNNEEDNTNSSADYNVGQMLWWNGKLYKVIRQIDAGDTFIVDTNIALVNFEDLFNDFVDEVKHDITANDDGGSPTATQSWTAGTWLWLNDVLYIVKNDITQGNAYVFSGDNANVEQITVEGEIKKEAAARANADTALQGAIGDEATARSDADTSLQNQIGDLSVLETDNKNNLVIAINEVVDTLANYSSFSTPEEYGAVGDGVTDDTEAVQASITNSGDRIVLLSKKYKITSPINLVDGITIIGTKDALIVDNITTSDSYEGIFTGNDISNININNVNFVGANENGENWYSSVSILNGALFFQNCNNINIDNCKFVGIVKYGIMFFLACDNVHVAENYIKYYVRDGIMCCNNTSNAIIENNIINLSRYWNTSDIDQYAISLSGYANNWTESRIGGVNLKALNNRCICDRPLWEGIDSHGGDNIEIAGNFVSGFRLPIAIVSNETDSTRPFFTASYVNIHDNQIIGAVAAGTGEIDGASGGIGVHGLNVIIANNNINQCGRYWTSNDNGESCSSISLGGSVLFAKISGNLITRGGGVGIRIRCTRGTQDVMISDNIINAAYTVNGVSRFMSFLDTLLNGKVEVANNTFNGQSSIELPATVSSGGEIIMNNNAYNGGYINYINIENCKPDFATAAQISTITQGRVGDIIKSTGSTTIAGWYCQKAAPSPTYKQIAMS